LLYGSSTQGRVPVTEGRAQKGLYLVSGGNIGREA
jgi:hypothetical protein